MRAARVAALDTRRAKDYAVIPDQLVGEWRRRAAALGLTQERVVTLKECREPRRITPAELNAAFAALAGADGLTAQRSSFTRREVLQTLCERLPVGADVAELEATAEAFLDQPRRAVPLVPADRKGEREVRSPTHPRAGAPAIADGARVLTPELLALELTVIEWAIGGRRASAEVAAADAVDGAVEARPMLSGEQRVLYDHGGRAMGRLQPGIAAGR